MQKFEKTIAIFEISILLLNKASNSVLRFGIKNVLRECSGNTALKIIVIFEITILELVKLQSFVQSSNAQFGFVSFRQ